MGIEPRVRVGFFAVVLVLVLGGVARAEKPVSLLTDAGVGPIKSQSKLTKKLLEKAFPGAKVVRRSWEGEGGDLQGFDVVRRGEPLARALGDDLTFSGKGWKTDKGIAIGSKYEELKKLYPRLICIAQVFAADGTEGPNSCSSPDSLLSFEVKLRGTPRIVPTGDQEAPCRPDGDACCEMDGLCNHAALTGAVVERVVIKLAVHKLDRTDLE